MLKLNCIGIYRPCINGCYHDCKIQFWDALRKQDFVAFSGLVVSSGIGLLYGESLETAIFIGFAIIAVHTCAYLYYTAKDVDYQFVAAIVLTVFLIISGVRPMLPLYTRVPEPISIVATYAYEHTNNNDLPI